MKRLSTVLCCAMLCDAITRYPGSYPSTSSLAHLASKPHHQITALTEPSKHQQ